MKRLSYLASLVLLPLLSWTAAAGATRDYRQGDKIRQHHAV